MHYTCIIYTHSVFLFILYLHTVEFTLCVNISNRYTSKLLVYYIITSYTIVVLLLVYYSIYRLYSFHFSLKLLWGLAPLVYISGYGPAWYATWYVKYTLNYGVISSSLS